MKDDYVVNGLKRLHGELHARLSEAQAQSRKLAADMRHVEHVIKLFRPNEDVRSLVVVRRRHRSALFKRGHIIREVLTVLRQEARPMTIVEIADALLATKAIAEPSYKQRNTLQSAVRNALLTHEKKIVVRDGARPPRWTPLRLGPGDASLGAGTD